MDKVKVRFAPSPTGPLHIGGARSALFNYLYALNQGGELVLRIEDTDLERSRREYEEEIIHSLQWLGITWNEGIGIGGENGPYRQTERLDIYQRYVQQLLDSGQAYYCYCSEEELEEQRQELMAQGEMPRYMGKCRNLSDEARKEREEQGIKPTIRFKVPENKEYVVDDMVRGQVSFGSDNIGDFIIVKSDGIPTYNFAVVIDDHLMGITHVVRAEEHLSNTPRQLMLYDALGFKHPRFAHISLILGNDRQKMSKRHGATSLIQYREMGYLPEAMFNFLAFMGWSPEGEEQILSPQQIIASFSMDRVAKSPAVFDLDKLNWINQHYIKQLDISKLKGLLKPFLDKSKYRAQIEKLDDYRVDILLQAIHDRLVCLGDLDRVLEIFFQEAEFEEEALTALNGEGVSRVLEMFCDELPEPQAYEQIKQFLKELVKKTGLKAKNVYMPLRCALTGQTHGMEMPYLILIWGRDECLRRIERARARISDQG
ncbi:MAG: glutamate--tRNA ligase [Syntrophomonadaceae bacterium]|jgi:nondiscriminating glutamyl-tRNA synthetase